MAMRLTPTQSLAFPGGQARFIDEEHACYLHGNGISIVNVDKPEECDFIANSWERGISALTTSPQLGCIAYAPRMHNPVIRVIQYPEKEIKATLEDGTDLEYIDMSFSRDGTRLAAISAATDYKLFVWNVETGEKLITQVLPTSCRFCSINPSDADLICTGGRRGLFVWRLNTILGEQTITMKRVAPPNSGDDAMVADANDDEVDDEDEDEDGGPSGEPDFDEHFTAHCWGTDDLVYAVNASGNVVEVAAASGHLSRAPLNLADASGLCTGLMLLCGQLLTIWSDGVVRYLNLAHFDCVEATATVLQLTNGQPPVHISSASPSPSYERMLVGTRDGTLHLAPIRRVESDKGGSSPTILELMRDCHRGPITSVAVMLTPELRGELIIATAGVDGTLRLWGADGGPRGHRLFKASQQASKFGGGDDDGGDGGAGKDELVAVPLTALAISPSQPLFAVGLAPGILYLVHALPQTGEKRDGRGQLTLASLSNSQLHHSAITACAFHPVAPVLAVCSASETGVHIIDLSPTGNFQVLGYAETVDSSCALSLLWHGENLLVGSESGSITAVEIPTSSSSANAISLPAVWTTSIGSGPITAMSMPLIGAVAPRSDAPFYAASSSRRALCAYTPPAEVTGSQPALSSTFTDADVHQKGILVIEAAPNGEFFATGGVDGIVAVWKIIAEAPDKPELVDSTAAHCGAVISIAWACDCTAVYSSGVDHAVFRMDLAESRQHRHPPFGTAFMHLAEKARSVLERPVPPPRSTWREERQSRIAESAALEVEAQKSVQRNVVADLSHRLRELLVKNEQAPELERLEREAFVINAAGRQSAIDGNKSRAEEVRTKLKSDDDQKNRVALLLKDECWESMDVQQRECRALLRPNEIIATNFALANRTPAQMTELERLRRMRVLELRDMALKASRGSQAVVWPNRNDEVPRDVSWIMNEGTLRPVLDVVEAMQNSSLNGIKDKAVEGEKPAAAAAADDEHAEGEGSTGKHNEEEEEEEGGLSVDLGQVKESSLITLLYPPSAVQTPNQKRVQIALLSELVYQMQLEFNKRFDKLFKVPSPEHTLHLYCRQPARLHPPRACCFVVRR
jgi:WD40 repeat protein